MKRIVVKAASSSSAETSAAIAREYAHQLHADALSHARFLVKGCTTSFRIPEAGLHYILEAAREAAEDVVGEAAASTFTHYCKVLWLEDTALEKRWTHRTTNDAIDEAFAALNRQGVVALQNVGGTTGMGWAEVNGDVAKLEAKKKKVLGGCFYHSQDTQRGVAGEGLLLAFGARDASDEGARRVADKVLRALRGEGVACEWSEDIDQRIRVLPFLWQKRRMTQAPRRQTPLPWRTFVHPDGRRWEIAGLNNHVCIRVTASDGELFERRTPSEDVAAAIAGLTAAQIAEGFVEQGGA